MGLFSKILAGGLGWAVGGPVGAIIGVVAASLLGGGARRLEQTRYDTVNQRTAAQNDFKVAMLVLMAAVMKADGSVVKSELNVVKSYLLKHYGEDEALDALRMLRELLKQDIDYRAVAGQVRMNVTYSARLQLLHVLFSIAMSDGQMPEREMAVVKAIADAMGVYDSDFRSIMAMFSVSRNEDWAYEVLEIKKEATDDEVKKAYRRMAMKYHPDKLAGMGEDIKQQSTEKFRKINEAYEHIKSVRGMK
ncbi:MAG: TerB family tellurite resistance protein [bacterium]|uniref:TerB family tellurite resistance protein n=1 Tax=Candidatus Aphodosoma intestinipullorum TaxID=2840674 RepID=A0A940DN77_9BACT|nr:TerB family tellurite resistance protein [Candidatus Aphodosoma intestinipullorum]